MQYNEPQFYYCSKTQTIIEEIQGNQEEFSCPDGRLQKLTANTSEGTVEKHLPVIEQSNNKITVKVGSTFHPMSDEHSIKWIYLLTEKGCQRVNLKSTEEPVATFHLSDGDKAIATYSYCNLHGLWKTNI